MPDTAPLHILLVDDDRLVLASLARALRDAGLRVSAAAGGEDALAVVEHDPPDLAILDVRMPGMNGIELGRRIRRRMPFMYLSAYGDEDTVRDAVNQGALGYFVKPLDVAQILPSFEAALARARDIRALEEKEIELSQALRTSRSTATAVGLLMERNRLDRKEAFELLRSRARAARRRVSELADEIIALSESLNKNK